MIVSQSSTKGLYSSTSKLWATRNSKPIYVEIIKKHRDVNWLEIWRPLLAEFRTACEESHRASEPLTLRNESSQ